MKENKNYEKVWEEKYPTSNEALNNDVPDHICLHFSEQMRRKVEIENDVLRYDISKLEEKIKNYKKEIDCVKSCLETKKKGDEEILALLKRISKKLKKIQNPEVEAIKELYEVNSLLKRRSDFVENRYAYAGLVKATEILEEYE